jgi:hypothetical protein
MRLRLATAVLVSTALGALIGAVGCASPASGDAGNDPASSEDQLVGGTRDQRWAASGYLLAGASTERLDTTKVACGATLIAPRVVVTAAHCVTDTKTTFAFGTGDVGSGQTIEVVERHAHPEFHPVAQGDFDLTHALRKFDVAYLVLARAVEGITPAQLIAQKPPVGCNVQAIGWRKEGGGKPVRESAPACVLFRVQLGEDPIFEVHPAQGSALCHLDGDQGSPVVRREGDKQILVGIYVGSVTQSFTDCVAGTQFLDGYESMFGYGDFLRAGIAGVK